MHKSFLKDNNFLLSPDYIKGYLLEQLLTIVNKMKNRMP